MINNILNNVLNLSSKYLSDAKAKVLETSKKLISNNIPKVPNTQDFVNQLKSVNVSNFDDIQKAENVYNKYINLVDLPISIFEGKRNELTSINSKLDLILSNFQRLNQIVETINPVIGVIRALIPLLNNLLVAQNPATGINGKTLKVSFDKIDDLKLKLNKTLDSISSISSSFQYFNDEVQQLKTPLDKGIENIDIILDKLYQLRLTIDNIYKQFLSRISFPELNDLLEDNNISLEEFVENNFENIISNQNLSLKSVIKIYSTDGNNVGYEITKE